jgi:transposase
MDTATKAMHIKRLCKKFKPLEPMLNERQRRIWAATEALEIGYGGVTCVAEAAGLARSTVQQGLKDLKQPGRKPKQQRIRRAGGGRKLLTEGQPELSAALDALVDPETRGDPETPLRWTLKSTRRLAQELQSQGFVISHQQVMRMLKAEGYSLQGNKKTIEGKQHPDRNAQFEYISEQVKDAAKRKQPVISVDTKKKELIGQFKNAGREWCPRGKAEKVDVHDFPDKELGKVVPYGVYDLAKNKGWVNLGINHDTAEFAVASISRWWDRIGKKEYSSAKELTITADSGGSNSYRNRAWRVHLQNFADKTQLRINVRHFPPGTSKWNKIEHRMFCHISKNWRGRPLVNRETVISLIGSTTTKRGLTITAALDQRFYPKGVKISDEALAQIRIKSAIFHGEWNYTILPQKKKKP